MSQRGHQAEWPVHVARWALHRSQNRGRPAAMPRSSAALVGGLASSRIAEANPPKDASGTTQPPFATGCSGPPGSRSAAAPQNLGSSLPLAPADGPIHASTRRRALMDGILVALQGRIGQEPERRFTSSGAEVYLEGRLKLG